MSILKNSSAERNERIVQHLIMNRVVIKTIYTWKVLNGIVSLTPKTAQGRNGIPNEAWWYVKGLFEDSILKAMK